MQNLTNDLVTLDGPAARRVARSGARLPAPPGRRATPRRHSWVADRLGLQ